MVTLYPVSSVFGEQQCCICLSASWLPLSSAKSLPASVSACAALDVCEALNSNRRSSRSFISTCKMLHISMGKFRNTVETGNKKPACTRQFFPEGFLEVSWFFPGTKSSKSDHI